MLLYNDLYFEEHKASSLMFLIILQKLVSWYFRDNKVRFCSSYNELSINLESILKVLKINISDWELGNSRRNGNCALLENRFMSLHRNFSYFVYLLACNDAIECEENI